MKHWILLLALLTAPLAAEEGQPAKDPLDRLIQGNSRYVNSQTVCHNDWTVKRSALLQSQKPYAVIVCCSDSRVPPELIFDQTLGDLFVVRVAGNVIDDFAIGSVEYGVDVLGANLVMVLGHSQCGAVNAALSGKTFDDHIQDVVNAIKPAVTAVKGESGDLLEKAIKANIKNVAAQLKASKPILGNLVEKGTLKIVEGYYQLDTGKVEIK
jgi:carbonic anhydrase